MEDDKKSPVLSLNPVAKTEDEKKEYQIVIEGNDRRREIHLSTSEFNFGILLLMTCIFVFIGTCGYSIYNLMYQQRNVKIVQEVQRAGEMQQEQLLAISQKAANLSETLQNLAQQEEELRIQAGLNKPAKEDKVAVAENPEDEIPELEEIKPIEGLPKPEDLPALENIPPTVEIPRPEIKSEWIPPAPLEASVPLQNSSTTTDETPTNSELPADNPPNVPSQIKSEWIPPEPLKNPIDEIKSVWLIQDKKFEGQGGPLPDLNIEDVAEALEMIEERVAIRQESLNEFQDELKTRREQMAVVAVVPSTPSSFTSYFVDNGFSNDLGFDFSEFGGSPSTNPNMPSIWPTNGVVTSPYGLRWGGTDFHPGIDIANDLGTPIVATADGIVEYAGWNAGGYGNMVDINHGNGLMTRYGHASQVVVTTGQHVKRGQLIAYMGSTGFSTGPHVHYEVHVNGQRVNPISYL